VETIKVTRTVNQTQTVDVSVADLAREPDGVVELKIDSDEVKFEVSMDIDDFVKVFFNDTSWDEDVVSQELEIV
tara:strand:+ start:507 stop:728 length:222 start_codon:yes stop_codon:yes gene_type:complete